MSNFTNQCSFYQDITREITSLFHNFLSIANLINLFGRNQYLRYILSKVAVSHFSFKIFFNLRFFTTHGTKYVPFFFNLRHFSNCLLVRINNVFHDKLEGRIHKKNNECNE